MEDHSANPTDSMNVRFKKDNKVDGLLVEKNQPSVGTTQEGEKGYSVNIMPNGQ